MTSSARSRAARENTSRRSSASAPTDPEQEDSDMESEDLELWKLLPQLKDLPETLVKKLPISALFQLNSALAKESVRTEILFLDVIAIKIHS